MRYIFINFLRSNYYEFLAFSTDDEYKRNDAINKLLKVLNLMCFENYNLNKFLFHHKCKAIEEYEGKFKIYLSKTNVKNLSDAHRTWINT